MKHDRYGKTSRRQRGSGPAAARQRDAVGRGLEDLDFEARAPQPRWSAARVQRRPPVPARSAPPLAVRLARPSWRAALAHPGTPQIGQARSPRNPPSQRPIPWHDALTGARLPARRPSWRGRRGPSASHVDGGRHRPALARVTLGALSPWGVLSSRRALLVVGARRALLSRRGPAVPAELRLERGARCPEGRQSAVRLGPGPPREPAHGGTGRMPMRSRG